MSWKRLRHEVRLDPNLDDLISECHPDEPKPFDHPDEDYDLFASATESDQADDDDNPDAETNSNAQAPDWDWELEPCEAEEAAIDEEIKSVVAQQNVSQLVALYCRSSSRDDLVDVFWLSKDNKLCLPFYQPAVLIVDTDAMLEEVAPVPLREMWVFVKFVEAFQTVFLAVREKVLQAKGDLLPPLYRSRRTYTSRYFHGCIENEILMRVILEGEKAIAARSHSC